MKNYLIVALIIIILVLSSFLYRNSKTGKFYNFPKVEKKVIRKNENRLNIYIFFSSNNCPACLAIIPVLNKLAKDRFKVIGVVNDNEFENRKILLKKTKALFELVSIQSFKRFSPLYWPSIMGVDNKRRVYFVLPAVPGESEYLEEFLQTFYYTVYERIRN